MGTCTPISTVRESYPNCLDYYDVSMTRNARVSSGYEPDILLLNYMELLHATMMPLCNKLYIALFLYVSFFKPEFITI
jgi:hypothetical protein